MFPVILLVFWHGALHLMHAGDWCAHLAGRSYLCTPASPRRPVVVHVRFREMAHLIRRGFECSRGARAWLCTPNQIPR